jgi:hypothetical protein
MSTCRTQYVTEPVSRRETTSPTSTLKSADLGPNIS